MQKKYDVIVDPDSGQRYYIDPGTGEAVQAVDPGCIVIPIGQIQERRRAAERWQKIQMSKSAPPFGSFTWVLISPGKPVLSGLTPSQVSKLLFLATDVNYDGTICPPAKIETVNKWLADHLKSYPRDITRFMTACQQGNYLSAADHNMLTLSRSVFSRGAMQPPTPGCFYIRMYHRLIIALYSEMGHTGQDIIYYLSQLLPYVNQRYNILCECPMETQIEKIKPLSWAAVCERIGYSKSHSARLSKLLFHYPVSADNHNEYLLVRIKGPPELPTGIYINPKLFYAGSMGIAQQLTPHFLVREDNLLKKGETT